MFGKKVAPASARVVQRLLARVIAAFACAALVLGCAACGGTSGTSGTSDVISVISREDGSGTRGAFTELLAIEDSSGNDATVNSAVVTNSTATVLTTVATDPAAIGYISLGSLNSSVKALQIDGVSPSIETVKDGSYPIARPFNVITGTSLSPAAQDFLTFILSAEGQAIVEENGYVPVESTAASYTANTDATGKVVVGGSSSVTPVMEKLAEAYQSSNPNVTVEVQQSDSSTGVQNVIDGVCDLGMASRDLKTSESAAGAGATPIAMDGIAVIVNAENTADNLSSAQVRDIYLGTITSWAEVAS